MLFRSGLGPAGGSSLRIHASSYWCFITEFLTVTRLKIQYVLHSIYFYSIVRPTGTRRGGNGPWPQWPLHSPTMPLNYLVQNCIKLESGLFRARSLNFLIQNLRPFTIPTYTMSDDGELCPIIFSCHSAFSSCALCTGPVKQKH